MPELLTEVASPTWAYLALLALLVADAFVPVIPTQVVMITGGALTVYGGLNLPVTIAVGALGVFVGDLACYLLGRGAPERRAPRDTERGRARQMAHRVTQGLRRPGPLVILLCRFVPGGRMAACFSAGRSRYPYRLFLLYEGLAALGWATYGGMIGHLGGTALTESAWRLALIAGVAAAGFAAAGWAMTVVGARRAAEAVAAMPVVTARTDAPTAE
ncbi:DedA family protein [Micromonospora peucetia]|uniref:DedA family protein n=1 Tax=Micromonospora peucetia TaxID=47871 RepID=A0A1C6UH30_9ACTN|nr:DedA family protein [Micromonospora peucetia]MCX4386726.1 DedA family protein [Micromonospora peucetia]WSA34050.1 DedA family protein [Micromonospora peucetia]SCL53254.1 membrane protein DedA, SNARE-associated domain [Micromonospora peucetia]